MQQFKQINAAHNILTTQNHFQNHDLCAKSWLFDFNNSVLLWDTFCKIPAKKMRRSQEELFLKTASFSARKHHVFSESMLIKSMAFYSPSVSFCIARASSPQIS